MRISDWSSDVCSSDLAPGRFVNIGKRFRDVVYDRVAGDVERDKIEAGSLAFVEQCTVFQMGKNMVHHLMEDDESLAEAVELGKLRAINALLARRVCDVFAMRVSDMGIAQRELADASVLIDRERSEEHTSELQ